MTAREKAYQAMISHLAAHLRVMPDLALEAATPERLASSWGASINDARSNLVMERNRRRTTNG